MGFVKKVWKNRISEYPTRRMLTKEDGNTELVTVSRSEGTVSQEGDAFCEDNMNNLETRIEDAFAEVNSNLTNMLPLGLTQEQYDVLSDTEKNNGRLYIIVEN